MSPGSQKSSKHLPALDGWRAIAILAVILSHTRWTNSTVLGVSRYGAMGVHLFFALSGFLITWRLIQEREERGTVSWTQFYTRRVFRILPAAFAYLFVIAMMGLGFHLIPVGRLQLLGSAFFFRNYLAAPIPEPWYTGHFWSLAVEEHFYLLWPLLLTVFTFRRSPYIAALLAVLVGVWRGLDMRYQWIAALDPLLKDDVRRTDYRLDILLWGCVFAFLWKQPWVRGRLRQIGASPLVLAVLLVTTACLYWKPPAYLAILAIAMGLLPIATVAEPESLVSRALEWGPLTWIGRVSYSIYLWQELFFPVYGVETSLGWLQTTPWNFLAAFGTAAVSYYGIERPCILLGKRLNRSTTV